LHFRIFDDGVSIGTIERKAYSCVRVRAMYQFDSGKLALSASVVHDGAAQLRPQSIVIALHTTVINALVVDAETGSTLTPLSAVDAHALLYDPCDGDDADDRRCQMMPPNLAAYEINIS
jgi:hypothetical protein